VFAQPETGFPHRQRQKAFPVTYACAVDGEPRLCASCLRPLPLLSRPGADALRTAIAKACRALGIPAWSPHDLRHRRVSLLHLRGVPWARIGEQVGQKNLAVTANTYTHVLVDGRRLSRTGFRGGLDSRMLSWGEEILRGHVQSEEVSTGGARSRCAVGAREPIVRSRASRLISGSTLRS
jgi:hypothetical protein